MPKKKKGIFSDAPILILTNLAFPIKHILQLLILFISYEESFRLVKMYDFLVYVGKGNANFLIKQRKIK